MMDKIKVTELFHCMDELEYYNMIKIDKTKRDAKENRFSLNVDLDELRKEINRVYIAINS
jgi:hypothetical protein